MVLAIGCERAPDRTTEAPVDEPRPTTWGDDLGVAIAQAKQAGARGVMVDVTAQWCNPCKELAIVFEKPAVRRALAGWVRVRLDATRGEPPDTVFTARWSGASLPLVLFLAPDGRELARVRQYLDETRFIAAIPP